MYSTSNGPTVNALARLHDVIVHRDLRRAGSLARLASSRPAVKGVGVDRHPQPRPQIEQRAEMILVGVGDDDAGEVRALLLDEARCRGR